VQKYYIFSDYPNFSEKKRKIGQIFAQLQKKQYLCGLKRNKHEELHSIIFQHEAEYCAAFVGDSRVWRAFYSVLSTGRIAHVGGK
jgi:hypothetical protein